VVNIELPLLRERGEDIPLLAPRFIEVIAKTNNRPARTISQNALECIMRYDWPGNIRELRNTLESMIVMSLKEQIEFEPESIRFEYISLLH
jgi:DNA-binding NtrC family response regulator